MKKSLLKPSGENLFQGIKKKCNMAEERGIKLLKMSIGQPSGPAGLAACQSVAAAVISREESMHEYQDNGSPGCPDFARRFVLAHPGNEVLADCDNVAFLPIPGIKPMLGVVVESLGGWEHPENPCVVATTCGYPTPAFQAQKALGVIQKDLPFLAEQGFLPTLNDLGALGLGEGDMIMLNLPNNPTGVAVSEEWYEIICGYCEERGIRLFNDAAYSILRHDPLASNLALVAIKYPNLSWAEAYSASKAGNNTGWRIGAMVGSPDCISDIAKIKGNTDSGFFAPAACGVISLFENHSDMIETYREIYRERIRMLVKLLTSEICNMRLPNLNPKQVSLFCFTRQQ